MNMLWKLRIWVARRLLGAGPARKAETIITDEGQTVVIIGALIWNVETAISVYSNKLTLTDTTIIGANVGVLFNNGNEDSNIEGASSETHDGE
jgi:hypothetical protein